MGRRLVLVCVEEGDELVFDGFGGGAGDLLAADSRDEGAEGVDCFGEAGGGEDGARVLGYYGCEAWVGLDEVGCCFVEEGGGGCCRWLLGGTEICLGVGDGWECCCLSSAWGGECGICGVGICWTRAGKRVAWRWCDVVDVAGAVWCDGSFDQIDEGWCWC